jgi:putative endonuclease
MDPRRAFGNAGEDLAADYLSRKGVKTLARQVRTDYGEIDLVCEEGDELVFVEVKTRQTDTSGPPEASITPAKFGKMRRCAESYVAEHALESRPYRLDVLSIWLKEGAAEPDILHFVAVDRPYGS